MDYNITYRQKDKSIQCIISYKDINGKWRQKSKQGFKTQKAAKPWINKTIKELEEQFQFTEGIDSSLVGITFKELCQNYISHKELYNQYNTMRSLKFAIKNFNELDDMEVTQIKNLHIQNCVDNMVKKGLKQNTIKAYLSMVKTIFNYAINPNKIIKENPCDNILIPANRKSDKVKALTKAELNDLLNKLKKRKRQKYYIISLLAGTCGLRLGEIMGLTWADIDTKNNVIIVNKQWKRLGFKKWGFGGVKQKNSNREVPAPPSTIKELQKYKANNPTDIHNRIILDTNVATLSTTLKRNYKKAGYDITVHDLRHTYATTLISNGIDFKTAAKLLGHDVEMTMRIYSHVNEDMMDKARNAISSIFHN